MVFLAHHRRMSSISIISTEAIVGVRRVDDSVSDVGVHFASSFSGLLFIMFERYPDHCHGMNIKYQGMHRVFQPGELEKTSLTDGT